ncbi:MAG: iron ABC transporter permease, partial [Defluviitaleaceae bacterium]|nr:iron ABC transporter permease [Defluviitaleaceae bacterium]
MKNFLTSKKGLAYGGIFFICLILVVLVLIPLGMILSRSFIYDGEINFSRAFFLITNSENLKTITNTLVLGFSVVICSTLIALPLAFLTARTQIAKHKWLDIILMIPFMTPPYIASMGWILFTQKRGLFQQMFPSTGSFSENFISFWGIVLIMSFHLFPFILTIIKNALLNVGASLEESAEVFGAKPFYKLRRITVPLITGNYLIGALLVFVKAVSEFGTPATLGRRIGFNVFVTEIHYSATVAPIDFGKAASLSSLLIFICCMVWFVQNNVTHKTSYKLISGKGSRRYFNKLKTGKLFCAWTYIFLLLIIAIGIPYFSVTVTSLIKLRGFGMQAGNYTFDHYVNLFSANPRGLAAFKNSIFFAVTSATIATLIGTAAATIIHYAKNKFLKLIHVIGLMPEMLPNIVFVIGIMIFWNTVYHIIPVYNSIWIIVLSYVTLFLPFSIQYVTSSYSQIGDNLVWAGKVFGGTPAYIFRRITL